MVEDLFSKQKAAIWLYFWFKPNANMEPDNLVEGRELVTPLKGEAVILPCRLIFDDRQRCEIAEKILFPVTSQLQIKSQLVFHQFRALKVRLQQ